METNDTVRACCNKCGCFPCTCNTCIGITGPTGPTGATGATGGSAALSYGGLYTSDIQILNLAPGVETQVTLSTALPASNVTYTPANSITISQTGVYKIDYMISLIPSASTSLTLAVRSNGIDIPSTLINQGVTLNDPVVLSGSSIVSLSAGTVLDLAVTSSVSSSLIFSLTGVNSFLQIQQFS